MDSNNKKHYVRIAHYTYQIKAIFDKYNKEFAKLGLSINYDKEQGLFYFKDYPQINSKAEKLFKQFSKEISNTIKNASSNEWDNANKDNDNLALKFLHRGLKNGQYAHYFNNHDKAREEFLKRKESGMNLSERVWKYTQMYKENLEDALSVGIESGMSANELSRKIQQYLNEPNKLFRRVRDEHGVLRLSKNAKAYHPGIGVYRSSYKNAMRLARTEINMAYRYADYERWKNMDFVLGVKIQLSGSHPKYDICDILEGDYPANFKFGGWHPHCLCFATPILQSKEDFLAGKKAEPITNLPKNFSDWLKYHKEDILKASEKGKLPYFIKDNFAIDNEGNATPLWNNAPSLLEIARQRHSRRTQKQIDKIKKRWNDRRANIKFATKIEKYVAGISDIDTLKLATALKTANYKKAVKEAIKLKNIAKQIKALEYIENPIQVANMFSMTEAIAVNNAIKTKLSKLSNLPLEAQQKKLKFEIMYVENPTLYKSGAVKYPTWKVAQKSYQKALQEVENEIYFKTLIPYVEKYKGLKTISKQYKELLQEFDNGIIAKDVTGVQNIFKKLDAKYNIIVTQQQKRKNKEYFKGEGIWQKEGNYSEEEIKKIQALEEKMLSAIMFEEIIDLTSGTSFTLTSQEIEKAEKKYSEYILSLSEKYYPQQTSKYNAKEIAKMEKDLSNYINEHPQNPNYVWGVNIGGLGILNTKLYSYVQQLTNVSAEELSLIVRFTQGTTFYNAYNLKDTSECWNNIWKQKMSLLDTNQQRDMERIIGEYTGALNNILNKMKRYNGIVFRGLKGKGASELIQSLTKAWDSGKKIWENLASCSTSTSLGVAVRFDNEKNNQDLIMIIRNKTGVYIQPVSDYPAELEVVLHSRVKYKLLTRPYFRAGKYWVELEEIV